MMSQRAFNQFAGYVFLLVAIMHFFRIINGWEAQIHTVAVPMWASWVALLLGAYLAYNGLRKR